MKRNGARLAACRSLCAWLADPGLGREGESTTTRTLLATPAARVMRPVRPSIEPGQPLAIAASRMAEHEVRELPVVAPDGRLVGIVTVSDLLPFRGHLEWTPTSSAMTLEPRSVGPDTSVGEVAELLLAHKINALPVAQQGVLYGMIRRVDLLRLLTDTSTPSRRPPRRRREAGTPADRG